MVNISVNPAKEQCDQILHVVEKLHSRARGALLFRKGFWYTKDGANARKYAVAELDLAEGRLVHARDIKDKTPERAVAVAAQAAMKVADAANAFYKRVNGERSLPLEDEMNQVEQVITIFDLPNDQMFELAQKIIQAADRILDYVVETCPEPSGCIIFCKRLYSYGSF